MMTTTLLYYREEERLKTFENRWPIRFVDIYLLAQTGMYYVGINDNTKCYFCDVEIGRWEVTDHPVTEHMRWSPNCPLLRRRTTNNIPLNSNALDRSLPQGSYEVCGTNELIEIRPDAYPEDCCPPPPPTSAATPDYAIESHSFMEWPKIMKQKTQASGCVPWASNCKYLKGQHKPTTITHEENKNICKLCYTCDCIFTMRTCCCMHQMCYTMSDVLNRYY